MKYDKRHGGPYDRGSADSYYRRPHRPHYYTGGTYKSRRVEEAEMTKEQIAAYSAGFYDNEARNDYKDYGTDW